MRAEQVRLILSLTLAPSPYASVFMFQFFIKFCYSILFKCMDANFNYLLPEATFDPIQFVFPTSKASESEAGAQGYFIS